MNTNRISIDKWSNPTTEEAFQTGQVHSWTDDWNEHIRKCESCSFFAPLTDSFGVCCHSSSGFYTETLFDEFTCRHHVLEGEGVHSFSVDSARHCKCQGAALGVYEEILSRLNKRYSEWKSIREPGDAPNDGPQPPVNNPKVTDGPSSVI